MGLGQILTLDASISPSKERMRLNFFNAFLSLRMLLVSMFELLVKAGL